MQKKFRISVDGRPYNVVVEEISDCAPATPVAASAAVSSVAAPPPPAAISPAPQAANPGDEVSPLAGVVVSVDVKVGDVVKPGDKIAVIEAMKMKTEVFAKHGGSVATVLVKAHDAVETGQPLLSVG